MGTPRAELRADCAHCAALCCVSLAFDRSEWFGFDKPSDVPCRHLLDANRCGIHGSLRRRGFAGCAEFECYGAGQRVTALFGDRAWREQTQHAPAMFSAFRSMRHVHELLLLLEEAGRLELPLEHAERRTQLLERLEPKAGWTAEAASAFDASQCEVDVYAFLAGLRDYVIPRPKRRLPVIG